MSQKTLYYKQWAHGTNVSIERHTENVPHDKNFHILRDGKTVGSYKSRTKALEAFSELLDTIGHTPPPFESEAMTPFEMELERQHFLKEMYWANSHRFGHRFKSSK